MFFSSWQNYEIERKRQGALCFWSSMEVGRSALKSQYGHSMYLATYLPTKNPWVPYLGEPLLSFILCTSIKFLSCRIRLRFDSKFGCRAVQRIHNTVDKICHFLTVLVSGMFLNCFFKAFHNFVTFSMFPCVVPTGNRLR